jgi:hypothetical protein
MKQQDSEFPVCNSFDCNRVINQRSLMSPVMFRSQLEFQRNLLKQHRERQQEKKRQIQQFEVQQKKDEEEILSRVLAANSHLSPDLKSIVIFQGLSAETPVPEKRILEYLNHLSLIIDEAARYQTIEDCVQDEHSDALSKQNKIENRFAANPALQKISDQLCALCKGGCCVSGNEHAYLSVFTMRQQLDKNSHWTQQDLFQQYVARISSHSMDGSCINHTSKGCALPRELRSNICNAFYCSDLKAYQQAKQSNEPENILVIQREDSYSAWANPDVQNNVVDVMLLQHDSVREVNRFTGKIIPISEKL